MALTRTEHGITLRLPHKLLMATFHDQVSALSFRGLLSVAVVERDLYLENSYRLSVACVGVANTVVPGGCLPVQMHDGLVAETKVRWLVSDTK